MSIKKYLKVIWSSFDTLMVLMILVLLTIMISGSEGIGAFFDRPASLDHSDNTNSNNQRLSSNVNIFTVAPIAYERSRSSQIARSIVSTGIARLPSRQSLDIREHERKYEVRFSLPQGVCEENLNLEVAGNILTLIMESGQKTYMRRIRIPCDYAQESSLKHFVSNQVLFVEISKL